MKKQQLISSLLLLLTAVIWGVAFTAQSEAGETIEAFTFTCVRSIIGGIVLLPVIAIFGKKPPADKAVRRKENKNVLVAGIVCGVLLMIAQNLQQLGINMGASSGKAGFITACYIIFVPIFGIFLKRRCSPLVWIAVALAAVGLYLLCVTDRLCFEPQDILLFACAIMFTLQILAVDRFSPKVDCVKLACVQFFVSGILSGILMLILETPNLNNLLDAWLPILYTGVLSSGVAYTLQIVGQKGLNPAVASIIMSLESAIAAIAGWLILGQNLSPREIIGCVVMFAAIIIAQVPIELRKKEV
ncbi:MAG: DMT family transporter [Clostridia bacterium]|nr:DMT family transporter [Clostridia bacterium]